MLAFKTQIINNQEVKNYFSRKKHKCKKLKKLGCQKKNIEINKIYITYAYQR